MAVIHFNKVSDVYLEEERTSISQFPIQRHSRCFRSSLKVRSAHRPASKRCFASSLKYPSSPWFQVHLGLRNASLVHGRTYKIYLKFISERHRYILRSSLNDTKDVLVHL